MILAGVGASQKHIEADALSEAYEQAIKSLEGKLPSFLLLFVSSTTYDQQKLLTDLKTRAPLAVIAGASTAGEITSVMGSVDKSIALMAIYSDTMKFVLGVGKNVKENSRNAGEEMARDIEKNGEGKPKAILMIPDGLQADGGQVVEGVLDVFGKDFMLAGGSAGDDYTFKGTYQYFGNTVLQGCVVGIGLYGDFSFGIGVRHGLTPITAGNTITKAKGNIVYEIDDKPAFSIYERYLGKEVEDIRKKGVPMASLTALYPIGIHAPNKEGYLVRGILSTDDTGAITLTSGVPEGSEVFLMIASQEEAIVAAEDAARQMLRNIGDKKMKAVFLFNCISRKMMLVGKRQQEIDKMRAVLGNDVPLIGFYTYGEQAPLGEKIITCSFHNQTDVLFALAE